MIERPESELEDLDGTVVADIGVDPLWAEHPDHGQRRGYITVFVINAEPPEWPTRGVNVRVTNSLEPRPAVGITLRAEALDRLIEGLQIARRMIVEEQRRGWPASSRATSCSCPRAAGASTPTWRRSAAASSS